MHAVDTAIVTTKAAYAYAMKAMTVALLTAPTVRTFLAIFVFCSLSLLVLYVGECPSGVAWTDKAFGVDAAHQQVPCSNAGICDVVLGVCQCFSGFTGSACQRSEFSSI